MIRFSHSSLFAFLLTVLAPGSLEADQVAREFRPLEAKQIEIQPAAKANPSKSQDSAATPYLRTAWSHFDSKSWDAAMNSFLAALEADPESREAAEGLAMSIYQSGDYDSAYRLGEELKVVMPNVRRMIAETALHDARALVAKGQFSAARAFLAHFPATGPTLAYAHDIVHSADTLTTAVNSNEAQPLSAPLVRN
ncbi:MAG: hypothetical protein AAGF67_00080 [Verrucomicrobiota bacterium]